MWVVGAGPTTRTFRSIGTALLLLVGAMVLLPRLLQLAEISAAFLGWPWQFDYDEGINLNATLQLAQGRNIYRHNGPDGFISAPYPPLLYIVNGSISLLTGAALWPGRLLSLLATIAIAALIFYVVRRVTALWGPGLLAAGLWLALSPVIVWSTLYKQDMPALALGLAGLAWAVTYPQGRRVYIAALFFALAFYTKQSALAAAAATTLWLILRDWRIGLRFAGVLALLITLPFIAANWLLKGGLWEHLVGNHILPWTLKRFNRTLRPLLNEYWPLLLWAFVCLAASIPVLINKSTSSGEKLKLSLSDPSSLLVLYFLVGGASTAVQMGYEGANYNHLLDGLLPLCLLVGLSVGWLWRAAAARGMTPNEVRPISNLRGTNSKFATIGLGAFGLVSLVQFYTFNDPHTWYRGGWPNPALDANMRSLSRLVASTAGDIYSENAHVLLINGKPVLYDDASTFVPLAQDGRWDQSGFVQSLRERRFPLVLLQQKSGRWTSEALQAFNESYKLKFRSIIETYEARLDPITPQYPLNCTLSRAGEEVALKGYTLGPGVAQNGVRRGDVLFVTLYWQPREKLLHSYATFIHLIDDRSERVVSRDNPQTGAFGPTTLWDPAGVTTDTNSLPIPSDLAAGKYRLLTGMYRQDPGGIIALASTCVQGQPYGDAVLLGEVDVK